MDVFDDVEAIPERFIESGDCVIVLVSLRGTVKRGGVPINAPFAHVWKFPATASPCGMHTPI